MLYKKVIFFIFFVGSIFLFSKYAITRPLPDLYPAHFYYYFDKKILVFKIVVSNKGEQEASNVKAGVFMNGSKLKEILIKTLRPFESVKRQFKLQKSILGKYSNFMLIVDYENTILEADETNNASNLKVIASQSQRGYKVFIEKKRVIPKKVLPFKQVEIFVTVINRGESISFPLALELIDTYENKIISRKLLRNLPEGAERIIKFKFIEKRINGFRKLKVILQPSSNFVKNKHFKCENSPLYITYPIDSFNFTDLYVKIDKVVPERIFVGDIITVHCILGNKLNKSDAELVAYFDRRVIFREKMRDINERKMSRLQIVFKPEKIGVFDLVLKAKTLNKKDINLKNNSINYKVIVNKNKKGTYGKLIIKEISEKKIFILSVNQQVKFKFNIKNPTPYLINKVYLEFFINNRLTLKKILKNIEPFSEKSFPFFYRFTAKGMFLCKFLFKYFFEKGEPVVEKIVRKIFVKEKATPAIEISKIRFLDNKVNFRDTARLYVKLIKKQHKGKIKNVPVSIYFNGRLYKNEIINFKDYMMIEKIFYINPVEAGLCKVLFRIDKYKGKISEKELKLEVIRKQPLPDLMIGRITHRPFFIKRGSDVLIEVEIKNIGIVPAYNIFLKVENKNGRIIYKTRIDEIEIEDSKVISFKFKAVQSGECDITLTIDPFDLIEEYKESNNFKHYKFKLY